MPVNGQRRTVNEQLRFIPMGVISWLLWGLFVGAIARLLRRGRQPIGILWTMILGVIGSLVGGFVATDVLNIADHDHFDLGSFLIAVGTSFLLLALWEPFERRRQRRQTPAAPV
jgi:uncharacterized membrane protein YeaQ/YmgE (transglycosylase-associated protein family)